MQPASHRDSVYCTHAGTGIAGTGQTGRRRPRDSHRIDACTIRFKHVEIDHCARGFMAGVHGS